MRISEFGYTHIIKINTEKQVKYAYIRVFIINIAYLSYLCVYILKFGDGNHRRQRRIKHLGKYLKIKISLYIK